MIELAIVIGLLALAAIVFLHSAGTPLTAVERLYLSAAPLPVVLALVIPSVLTLWLDGTDATRNWSGRLSAIGGWLSLGLLIAGALVLRRRTTRGETWPRRLIAAVLVAMLPAVMIGLIALFYAI